MGAGRLPTTESGPETTLAPLPPVQGAACRRPSSTGSPSTTPPTATGTAGDHGPVEAAYLAAIAAFADASDIDRLEIREPAVTGFVHFGVGPPVEGHGLGGLFPPDLTGYHDGAEVSLPVALELVRAMLRDQGAWCRLEVGTSSPCTSGGTSTCTWAATGSARTPWPVHGNSISSGTADGLALRG
ncbi:hypothetical protein ACR6C2_09870 [Streptomyces sp. INA 01156]